MLTLQIGSCYKLKKEITGWHPTDTFPMVTATQGLNDKTYWQIAKDTIMLLTHHTELGSYGCWLFIYNNKQTMIMLKISQDIAGTIQDPGDYLEFIC